MDKELEALSIRIGNLLKSKGLTLATAESCTGGWAAKVITDIPGSSHWFDRGFVTYTNIAKQEMLAVNENTLAEFGAVSEQTVQEMAEGVIQHSHADIALAISGIAGPHGDTPQKPLGMVCLAWSGKQFATFSTTEHYTGDREQVRYQAVVAALEGIQKCLETKI